VSSVQEVKLEKKPRRRKRESLRPLLIKGRRRRNLKKERKFKGKHEKG